MNYYNEFDPFAAKWLVELIKAGLIPNGEVDTRSIVDIRPADLTGFTQCHFFTGIGGWSHALRLAQWPDDKPIWTGSCPCQPFSVAGKGKGKDDDRHLWPVFFQLISECRPPIVMGEQVAGAAGYGWFDGVRSDLEREGYASRGVDISACAVDAPHIRQRLYWIATDMGDADDTRFSGHGGFVNKHEKERWHDQERCFAETSILSRKLDQSGDVADTDSELCYGGWDIGTRRRNEYPDSSSGNYWFDAEWRTGVDGKARRVKPGVRLLADGIPNRVGKLRGYGNAIVPPLAAEVIKAFMETEIG